MRSANCRPALRKPTPLEIFDAVDRQGVRGQAELAEHGGGIVALEGEVVDGEDRARPLPAVVVQIGRRQRRLPVVGVDDFGREAGNGASWRCPRRRAPARRSGGRCRASRARPVRDRGCPAGRRDAARRARRGRGRRRARPEPAPARRTERDRRARARPSRAWRGSPDSPGASVRTATPSRASAPGRAPATSARPPVLISG